MSANSATVANVNDSASSVELFANGADSNINGRTVFNDSAQLLYMKFGSTASATDHTVQVPAGGYYEFPQPVFCGLVHGIWAADGSGAARTTQW